MLEELEAYVYQGFIIVEALNDEGKPSGEFLVLTGSGEYRHDPVSFEAAKKFIDDLIGTPPPPGGGGHRP